MVPGIDQGIDLLLLGRLVGNLFNRNLDRCRRETIGAHRHRNRARILCSAYDADELTGMGSAIVVAERLVIGLDAVVNAGDLALALNREGNLVLGRGNDDAILILNVHGEIREVGAVGLHGGTVHVNRQFGSRAGRLHALAPGPILGGDLLTLVVVRLSGNGAIGIGNVPGEVQVLMSRGLGTVLALINAVGVLSTLGRDLAQFLLTKAARLTTIRRREEQLDFGRIGVDDDLDLLVIARRHDRVLIPRGQDVEGVDVVVPLALIEVIRIFGQAGGIDDAKVGALRRGPCALRAGDGAV